MLSKCRLPAMLGLAVVLGAGNADAQSSTTVTDAADPLLAPVSPPARQIERWAEVTTMLRSRSVELAAAYASIRRAEADSRAALAPLFGQLQSQGQGTLNLVTKDTTRIVGVTPEGDRIEETRTSPTPRIAGASATATLPLIAPQQWQRVRTAGANVDLATELLADQQRVLVEKVASAIVGVVAAERVAEVNRTGLRAALERSALARRRQSIGGGTALDVVRADRDLEAARAQVVTGDESLRQAREALGLALGWGEQVGVRPTFRLDDAVRDASRECRPVGDLDKRADIVAGQRRVRVAEQLGREAWAGFFPTLAAQSQVSHTTQDIAFSYSTQWNVQAILSWNIWDGGTRYAQIRSSAAQRDSAAADLEGARRQLAIAVKRADRAIEVATASREIAVRARDAAAEQERLTRIAFTAGNGTSLELVTAAADLRTAEIQLALREYELVRARLLALLVRARCEY